MALRRNKKTSRQTDFDRRKREEKKACVRERIKSIYINLKVNLYYKVILLNTFCSIWFRCPVSDQIFHQKCLFPIHAYIIKERGKKEKKIW
jgi:hypothetical protein